MEASSLTLQVSFEMIYFSCVFHCLICKHKRLMKNLKNIPTSLYVLAKNHPNVGQQSPVLDLQLMH